MSRDFYSIGVPQRVKPEETGKRNEKVVESVPAHQFDDCKIEGHTKSHGQSQSRSRADSVEKRNATQGDQEGDAKERDRAGEGFLSQNTNAPGREPLTDNSRGGIGEGENRQWDVIVKRVSSRGNEQKGRGYRDTKLTKRRATSIVDASFGKSHRDERCQHCGAKDDYGSRPREH